MNTKQVPQYPGDQPRARVQHKGDWWSWQDDHPFLPSLCAPAPEGPKESQEMVSGEIRI